MKYKYNCLNPIAACGLDNLDDKYVRTEDFAEADAVFVRSAKMDELTPGANLLAVARAGAGVNNIPHADYAKKGIVVFNTPGANANGVKELVLGAMFLASRDLIGGIAWVQANKDDPAINKTAEKAKKAFAGTEIMGKTLGVIGLGAIGQKVANAAVALGMEVIGYDPYLSVDAALRLSSEVKVVKNVEAIYRACDFITVHVPALDSTKGMINAEAIGMMKTGVIIVNAARDAGSAYEETGATSTTDLAGKTRVIGPSVDIGAYEFDPSVPFADIMFTQDSRITPVTLSATANFVGASGKAVYYWDLDGDGIFERQTDSASINWTVENGIGPGRISMRVDVGGTIIGSVSRYFDYSPSDIYVNADSSNAVYPYCTPETAARYLQDALSVPGNGMTIHMAAGTYSSSATSAKFDVTNGVRVIGSTGNPDDVIIQNTATISGNSTYKTITVNHPDALVANATIRGAQIRNISGSAGLIIGSNGGTVSNCVVRDNYHFPSYYQASAGVYMSAGLITHCIITNNSINGKSTQENDATAVMMVGGALENSFVGANRMTGNETGKCFAIRATGGRIVNCDIIGNDLSSTNELAGALDVSGTAVVSNTVVFGNTMREIVDNDDETTSTNVVFALVTGATAETALTACATDLTIGATAFRDYAGGDYVPAERGLLYDHGVTPAGWNVPGFKDLKGHRRVFGASVDIGCYEFTRPLGMKLILW